MPAPTPTRPIDRSARNVETWIRPTPSPFSAGELARRDDPVGFSRGLQAGHADAIAYLRQLIHEERVAQLAARRLANRCSQEDPGRRRYDALALVHRSHVRELARIARALKEGDPR